MENKHIESLEKLIAIKDETIKELERQVQILKASLIQPAPVVPNFQWPTVTPNTQPYINPLSPPYTITSVGGAGTVTSSSDSCSIINTVPLPLGAVQTSGYIGPMHQGCAQSNPHIIGNNAVPNTNNNVCYIQKSGS